MMAILPGQSSPTVHQGILDEALEHAFNDRVPPVDLLRSLDSRGGVRGVVTPNAKGHDSLLTHAVLYGLSHTSEQTPTIDPWFPALWQGLLDHGANLDHVNSNGGTVLDQVVRRPFPWGVPDTLRWLMDRGAGAVTPNGITGLLDASLSTGNGGWDLLIGRGADVNGRDAYGAPLIIAATADLAATRALLTAGADPNARDEWDGSALHTAAWRGDPAVVRTLLAAGAAVHATTRQGQTPLMMAVTLGDPQRDAYRTLQGPPSRITRTLAASMRTTVNLLLRAGADPTVADLDGNTPLHRAFQQGARVAWPSACELVRQGASLDQPNALGLTARDQLMDAVGDLDNPAAAGVALARLEVLALEQGFRSAPATVGPRASRRRL